jgi:uncharacterized membrane protein
VPANHRYERDGLEFARAITFFDAIYAFSVTLLITTIDNFSPKAWSSLSALMDANGSSLLAFAISFVVVVRFWRVNHQEVTGFRSMDGRLITINCVVMFGIVLIPFATEAMGKLTEEPLPTAVYAVVITGTYAAQWWMILDADLRGLRPRRTAATDRRAQIASALVLPVVFLGSIPLAYLTRPGTAQLCWLSVIVLVPLVDRAARRSGGPSSTDPAR